MKKFYNLSILALTTISVIYSCSPDEEESSPPPNIVQTPPPTPEPAPVQYTLTVTAGQGGAVSTQVGTIILFQTYIGKMLVEDMSEELTIKTEFNAPT